MAAKGPENGRGLSALLSMRGAAGTAAMLVAAWMAHAQPAAAEQLAAAGIDPFGGDGTRGLDEGVSAEVARRNEVGRAEIAAAMRGHKMQPRLDNEGLMGLFAHNREKTGPIEFVPPERRGAPKNGNAALTAAPTQNPARSSFVNELLANAGLTPPN